MIKPVVLEDFKLASRELLSGRGAETRARQPRLLKEQRHFERVGRRVEIELNHANPELVHRSPQPAQVDPAIMIPTIEKHFFRGINRFQAE